MPISLSCPSCQKPYQVPETLAGKQVRCQKCSHIFTVAAAAPVLTPAAAARAPAAPALDPLLADLPPLGPALPAATTLPAAGLGTPLSPGGRPLGYAPQPNPYAPPSFGGPTAPPLEGPSDTQFRLGAAAAVGLGLLLAAICVGTYLFDESVFLWPLFIAPLLILIGIAGLIDPNVCRALGKYGTHLPIHYKLIAWSLMGVWIVIVGILVVVMANMGFRPGR
jgi:predicted Zn finger-like uncharacterized protein